MPRWRNRSIQPEESILHNQRKGVKYNTTWKIRGKSTESVKILQFTNYSHALLQSVPRTWTSRDRNSVRNALWPCIHCRHTCMSQNSSYLNYRWYRVVFTLLNDGHYPCSSLSSPNSTFTDWTPVTQRKLVTVLPLNVFTMWWPTLIKPAFPCLMLLHQHQNPTQTLLSGKISFSKYLSKCARHCGWHWLHGSAHLKSVSCCYCNKSQAYLALLPSHIVFCKNWKSVATQCQAHLSTSFLQQAQKMVSIF